MDSCSDVHPLPENCIANIISLTSPVDACRMSAVARIFHSAAEADAVWERFLPSNYREIISRASPDSQLNNFQSKKALYMYLCDNPILIDDGYKSFWLEKRSGKKCCRVSARDMWVVWSDANTNGYWKWVSRPESRFKEVVELIRVCWFQIDCDLQISVLSPGTEYAAYCLYTTNAAFRGFADHPVFVKAYIGGQERKVYAVSLVPQDGALKRWCDAPAPRNPTAPEKNYPKQRADGWMEIELGEFFSLDGEGSLSMRMMGEEITQWKSGIIVEGFEIRPKDIC